VPTLLDVDSEYLAKVAADRLPKIAPRRFNPAGEAWLPVLHAQREAWHFTALFSNTARAHQLGRSRDWVVIYFHSDHEPEGQCTVVTESQGDLAGRRVVRGREAECRAHYGARSARVE
jgi:putative hydrolase